MKNRYLSLVLMAALHIYSNSAASAEQKIHVLTAAQWNIPRDAQSILAMLPLQAVIEDFNSEKNSIVVIKYAGGDEGTLWIAELKSWLVSLGIPSSNIEFLPGASRTDQLELSVVKTH